MSGGVDSSVTAMLLQRQGYEVAGLFMKNWEEDDTDTYCSAKDDAEDAKRVCDKLGIELHTINFAAEYWDNVFSNFLTEYKAGRTPNPDILCNSEIKFKVFLEYAKHLGADFMATGHYAAKIENSEGVQLAKALDLNKDQSYFLYALNKQQLEFALFPLANVDKPTVRKLAKEAGLATFAKKDSTGICFIGERKFKQFLQTYLPATPGDIVTDRGKIIGKHDGLMYYTIGQRQGLGIGGLVDAKNEPWFVLDKDLNGNQLIVGQGHNNPHLFAEALIADQINWITPPTQHEFLCTAKIRYRQADQDCKVIYDTITNSAQIVFAQAQRAITPGQSIVFYNQNICLGGGIIKERIWKI